MEKKYLAGISVLVVCLVAASSAYAFGGFGQGMQGNEAMQEALESGDYGAFVEAISHQVSEEQFQRMAEMHQNRTQVQQALEAGDYDAWVEAIESQPKITDFVTEETFPRFVEMHEARQEGDFETAQAIAEELGLNQFGRGMKGPMGSRPPPTGGRMRGNGQ